MLELWVNWSLYTLAPGLSSFGTPVYIRQSDQPLQTTDLSLFRAAPSLPLTRPPNAHTGASSLPRLGHVKGGLTLHPVSGGREPARNLPPGHMT